MARKRNAELTAENLKQTLWDTLQGIREKRVDHRAANAIASQSREIMRVVKAEITIAQMSGGKAAAALKPKATQVLPKPSRKASG